MTAPAKWRQMGASSALSAPLFPTCDWRGVVHGFPYPARTRWDYFVSRTMHSRRRGFRGRGTSARAQVTLGANADNLPVPRNAVACIAGHTRMSRSASRIELCCCRNNKSATFPSSPSFSEPNRIRRKPSLGFKWTGPEDGIWIFRSNQGKSTRTLIASLLRTDHEREMLAQRIAIRMLGCFAA